MGTKREATELEKLEMRKEIFRKTAGTAIENSHVAIKQVWVVLFAGGTFALINSFDTLLGCAGIFDQRANNLCGGFPSKDKLAFWLLVSFYLVYIMTFYRFYVGNIRVFDMRYIEVGKFISLLSEEKYGASADEKDTLYRKFFTAIDDTGSRWWDSIFLIFKTLVIISLTIEINSPRIFITIYFFVMVLDIIWMMRKGVPKPFFRDIFVEHLGLTHVLRKRDKNFKGRFDMTFPS